MTPKLRTIWIPFHLFALALFLGAEPAKPTVEEELKNLQGIWKVTSAEVGGTATDVKKLGMEMIRITGNKLSLLNGDKTLITVEIIIDPTKTPKQMDWVEKEKGQYPLIYSLEGDHLQLCFPMTKAKLEAPLERPQQFNNPGKPIALLKAERQKGDE